MGAALTQQATQAAGGQQKQHQTLFGQAFGLADNQTHDTVNAGLDTLGIKLDQGQQQFVEDALNPAGWLFGRALGGNQSPLDKEAAAQAEKDKLGNAPPPPPDFTDAALQRAREQKAFSLAGKQGRRSSFLSGAWGNSALGGGY